MWQAAYEAVIDPASASSQLSPTPTRASSPPKTGRGAPEFEQDSGGTTDAMARRRDIVVSAFKMTEDAVSPKPDEAPAKESPDLSKAAGSEPGIGVGTGIVVGTSVGVLIASVAALWFGFQGPAATVGEPSTLDDTTSADLQPGAATPQRPATGADILPPDKTGGGSLILQNVGDLDTVVVLADDTRYARAVYVRSGERVTIPNVAAGTFEVLMMLGRNWNADRFTESATFQQIDQPIEFVERNAGSSTEYTQLTVSIEPWTPGLLGVRATAPFQLTAP
jgi:hypothetical protein